MARAGITEQQVFEAAEALLQEGQTATVSAVRERLGTGSYSTINACLGKWREDNKNRSSADIPDIPPSVENALRHVWALACREAQERIKVEREGLESVRREMEREKKVM
ncbi:MAG: DNA-binding protein, partial [Methylococcales bacterium]